MNKMTPLARFLLAAVIAGAIIGGYVVAKNNGLFDKIAPQGKQAQNISPDVFKSGGSKTPQKLNRPIRIGINTWCGFAGVVYWNKGMKVNSESEFSKDGLDVEISQIDDFAGGKDSWKANKIDVWYCTIDSFPVDVEGIKTQMPKVIMQTDWSRGGDAIVVRPGINTVADLKGKKVACAEGSPSHTFLLWMLSAGELNSSDVTLIKVANGIDAAAAFKANRVDAAVVWAPDDQDCIGAIPGSKVLVNTKQASNIIADAIYVKKDFADQYPGAVEALIRGWLMANGEINASAAAKKQAAKYFAAGFGVSEDFSLIGVKNARLCTYGDNINFFGLNPSYAGMNGQALYEKMSDIYNKIGLAGQRLPYWREIVDTSYLRNVNLANAANQSAEGQAQFEPIANGENLQAISSKKLSITFASGSSVLDQNAKYIIQMGFGDFIKTFASARIRIEGNTDSVGGDGVNVPLSKARAKSVANYIVSAYKVDADRLIIVGNGSTKPVASNDTSDGRAQNRRTDFEIVE